MALKIKYIIVSVPLPILRLLFAHPIVSLFSFFQFRHRLIATNSVGRRALKKGLLFIFFGGGTEARPVNGSSIVLLSKIILSRAGLSPQRVGDPSSPRRGCSLI